MAVWALPVRYPMAQLIGGFGIDGQDTALMLLPNRVSPMTGQPMSIQDLINAAPNLVVLRGGSINDLQAINSSNYNAVINDCLTNHREMLRRMVVDGRLKVLDCGIFGYGDGPSVANPNPALVRQALLQVNSSLATMAGEFGTSVRYVSPAGTLHDGTGKFKAGMSVDGLHLSLAGGLAQASLEAAVLTPWLGVGSGTAYPGTNLITSSPPSGYAYSGINASVDNPLVGPWSRDGKTYFTVRVILPDADASATIQLPFPIQSLGADQVLGCEFDFFYQVQSGAEPRLTEFDARQDYVWGGGRVTHFAAHSARESSSTSAELSGRVVFLPFRFPVNGSAFDANQSQLSLRLRFAPSAGTVLKFGVGNPRLARV
jgi:hypothetical protein